MFDRQINLKLNDAIIAHLDKKTEALNIKHKDEVKFTIQDTIRRFIYEDMKK